MDRIEAAVVAGQIDFIWDETPTERLEITTGEFGLLLAILFPEEYRGGEREPYPTLTAPGSDERIAVYGRRVLHNATTFSPADAKATTVHGPGLAIRVRRNGARDQDGAQVKVLGWEDEEQWRW